jgi:transposase-like protein
MDEKLFDAAKIEARLREAKSIADLTGKDGILKDIIKVTMERLLQAELEAHLGYPPNDKGPKSTTNRRNGSSPKDVKTSNGTVTIDVARDREGTFEPRAIEKHKTFDTDLEAKIISMYAKGISTRDMSMHLSELYGAEVSPTLVSTVTNRIMSEISDWQQRPLDKVYPLVFLDAFFYKTRVDSKVVSKACYSVLAVTTEGKNELLGIWVAESEGAHFWLSVLTDLKARGVEDILIACIDGLKDFPDAIATMFPKTIIQQCVVHQIRNSLKYVGSNHQKEFIRDLKCVYAAINREAARESFGKLEEKWGAKYGAVIESWKRHWDRLTAYFDFPEPIRKIIYTTNIVEGFHRRVRKVTKTKGMFPSDDAFKKLVYLVIRDIQAKEQKGRKGWGEVLSQLSLLFKDRLPADLVLR